MFNIPIINNKCGSLQSICAYCFINDPLRHLRNNRTDNYSFSLHLDLNEGYKWGKIKKVNKIAGKRCSARRSKRRSFFVKVGANCRRGKEQRGNSQKGTSKTNGVVRHSKDTNGWFKLILYGWRFNSLFDVLWHSRRCLIVTFAETSPTIFRGC